MVPEMNRVGEEIGLGGGLEKALLLFFLAADTVASPRNGFQSFLLHVLFAGEARPEVSLRDSVESLFDELQNSPVVAALVEKELFRVGVGDSVGNILGGLFVGLPAVLLALHDQRLQFFIFLEQPLPVLLDSSLVHGASLKLCL